MHSVLNNDIQLGKAVEQEQTVRFADIADVDNKAVRRHSERMADPIQTGFLSLTDRLSRFIPLLGAIDLAVAWLAQFLGFGNSTPLGLLGGFTVMCGVPVFLRMFFGSRGMRSLQQLGFTSITRAWWYAQWFNGYSPVPLAITLAAIATAAMIGDSHSTNLFLAFSVFWSVGIVSKFTRRWPSDDGVAEPEQN